MNFKGVILIIASFSFHSTFAQADGWYKCLNGSIDQYPVTLHLHKIGHQYQGYYYYQSSQRPIPFSGEDIDNTNKIKLSAYPEPKDASSEEFLFAVNGLTYTGTWKKSDISRSFIFTATESTDTEAMHLIFVYASGQVKLRPAWKSSPTADFESASVWPKNNDALSVEFKKLILAEFEDSSLQQGIGNTLLKRKKQFFSEYKTGNNDVKDSELKQNAETYNWSESDYVTVVYRSKNLISLANDAHSFTGGAHANYGTRLIPFNLQNKKKITLDDLFTKEGIARLPVLLEKYFRQQYDLAPEKPLTEGGLFENTIQPNDNFYVTGKGINFGYPPYEIGPFILGEINVFIPFTELNNDLQPDFKELIR